MQHGLPRPTTRNRSGSSASTIRRNLGTTLTHLVSPGVYLGLLFPSGFPTGLIPGLVDPNAILPAGLDAKVGRNLIPSAARWSSASSSSPAKRARDVGLEKREGVWRDEEAEGDHQSVDAIVCVCSVWK